MNTAHIVPLGDQAALITVPDEAAAAQLSVQLRQASWPWLVDVVQAYSSVGVYFDVETIDFNGVADAVGRLPPIPAEMPISCEHVVPCCYEFGTDLDQVAAKTGLSVEAVIRKHQETVYTVYAIGFCPGFPYLGYLPSELCGVPRLPSPRVRVEAGSVGLTGRQTGIYTEARPGGWNLIGRTPLELVNVADEYFPLRAGDRVRFEGIDRAAFKRLRGRRLSGA
jgi:inhibitor of KinA